ncbi:50S ribosomal protein L28 [candidate division WOR-3 bacterium 4484_100]|uniref:Large ribosomal subunit protein bL28 n=1 Tax=candidate division WOR-3 bacterium 4484_100 TaxID=1936077 RepID=A0A1V4QF15_UNCW3|nr:MAG: 50S ribosomal protein L28 [candidate division WOR-3 bacterium 4484_100]
MARRCAICGRGARTGSNISHAHNVTKRQFKVNLQKVRARIDGRVRKILVCTRCLHAGKVVKA